MGHLRANICKTEDGETLGSLGMVEENRGGTREAPASGQTNLFAAGAAVPFRAPAMSTCRRCSGCPRARRRTFWLARPRPERAPPLPLHLASVKHDSADELT